MSTNPIEPEKALPRMGDQLKGRVAIVTGAGSGLGKRSPKPWRARVLPSW